MNLKIIENIKFTDAMLKETILTSHHQQLGAKFAPFAGYDMPIHYGSQINEHKAVRTSAGIFDVSHMQPLDIIGPDAHYFVNYLIANDLSKTLKNNRPQKAIYTCMLNFEGNIIDDLIVYPLNFNLENNLDNNYRLILNAGCAEKDIKWIQKIEKLFKLNDKNKSKSDFKIIPQTDLSILAIQGPKALAFFQKIILDLNLNQNQNQNQNNHFDIANLKFFECKDLDLSDGLDHGHFFVARTGYTGESGVELILSSDWAVKVWELAIKMGVSPIGLGARDTLRLEAGLNLYGQDMTEKYSPFESNLKWTVGLDKDFLGKNKLIHTQPKTQLIGVVLNDKGILRHGQKVILNNSLEGEITSGSFSPSLNCSIGFARIPNIKNIEKNKIESIQVEIRNQLKNLKIIPIPFIKNGQPNDQLQIVLDSK